MRLEKGHSMLCSRGAIDSWWLPREVHFSSKCDPWQVVHSLVNDTKHIHIWPVLNELKWLKNDLRLREGHILGTQRRVRRGEWEMGMIKIHCIHPQSFPKINKKYLKKKLRVATHACKPSAGGGRQGRERRTTEICWPASLAPKTVSSCPKGIW